jgi:hypothetical protein
MCLVGGWKQPAVFAANTTATIQRFFSINDRGIQSWYSARNVSLRTGRIDKTTRIPWFLENPSQCEAVDCWTVNIFPQECTEINSAFLIPEKLL